MEHQTKGGYERMADKKLEKETHPYRIDNSRINKAEYVEDCLNCPYDDCYDACHKRMLKGKRREK